MPNVMLYCLKINLQKLKKIHPKKNLIKNNATKKINNAKTKFNKSNFKKKLLKFKNSKSYREYKEN